MAVKVKYVVTVRKHGMEDRLEFSGRCGRTAMLRWIDRELKDSQKNEYYADITINQNNA